MIRLGIIKDDGEILKIDPRNLRRHLCVFGMTGTGKSTTLSILAYELYREGIPSVIIDRTGEFRNKITKIGKIYSPDENLSLSPFQLWNDDPIEERIQKQVWLLEEFCKITWSEGLSPLQIRLLSQALYRNISLGEISFQSLIEESRRIAKEELRLWIEAAEALASRFGIFTVGKFKKAFRENHEELEGFFKNGINIIDLSSLEHEAPKNLFSMILITLLMLKLKKRGFTDGLRIVLMIDEAHNIANKNVKYGLVEKLAMEMRKYGLGLVISSPNPSEISNNILSNAGTLIIHQMFSGYEADVIKKYLGSSSYHSVLEEVLCKLNVGEAFIRTPNNTDGIVVKIGINEHYELIS